MSYRYNFFSRNANCIASFSAPPPNRKLGINTSNRVGSLGVLCMEKERLIELMVFFGDNVSFISFREGDIFL